jgi:hypothetical protein
MDVPVPTVTDRERRIFLTFAISAVASTPSDPRVIAFFVGRFMIVRFGFWGAVVIPGRCARGCHHAAHRAVRADVRTAPLFARRSCRVARRAAAVAAALLVVIAVTGIAGCDAVDGARRPATVTVEPASRVWLRPAA